MDWEGSSLERFFSWPTFIERRVQSDERIRQGFQRLGIGMEEVRTPFGYAHVHYLVASLPGHTGFYSSDGGSLSERTKNELWWKWLYLIEHGDRTAYFHLMAAMEKALANRTLGRRPARWLFKQKARFDEACPEESSE